MADSWGIFDDAPQPAPAASDPWGIFQAAAPYQPAPEQPGWGMRALEGGGSVLGAPKRAIDWLAREGAEQLYGLKQPEGTTTGSMLRAAAGLMPGADYRNEGYGGRLGGKAIEFATDVATDPVTWAMGGLGGAVERGATATAATEAAARLAPEALGALSPEAAAAAARAAQAGRYAAPVQRAASAAFTGLMGAGTLQEGSHAIDEIAHQGFTPQAAEDLLGTAASAYGAYEGGKHLYEGLQAARERAASKTAPEPVPEPSVAPEAAQEPTGPVQDPIETRLAEQAARAQAEVAAEGPAPGVGTPGAKPWETQPLEPVVQEPQQPTVVPEPQPTPEPALEPSLEDILAGVAAKEEPVQAVNPAENVLLKQVPAHLRGTAEALAEKHAETHFLSDAAPDEALDYAIKAAGLSKHAEAIQADAQARYGARIMGRDYVAGLRERYGDVDPAAPEANGVTVEDRGNGHKIVVQRHEGQVVGGGEGGGRGSEGERGFLAGGPKIGSPVSARPVYEALDELGYKPSTRLSPYGGDAQLKQAAKEAGRAGRDLGADAEASGAGARPLQEAGSAPAPQPVPPAREPTIRERVRALGKPEPRSAPEAPAAPEVAPAAQEPLGAPEPPPPTPEATQSPSVPPGAPQALERASQEPQQTFEERQLPRFEADLKAGKKVPSLRADYSLPLGVSTPAEARALLQERARSAAASRSQEPQQVSFSVQPNKLGFYSQLQRIAEKLPQAMRGSDLHKYLTDPKRGVKAEELKWTGLDDFLRSKAGERVTPQEVQEFLRQNEVQVKEVKLSDKPVDDTRHLADWLADNDPKKQGWNYWSSVASRALRGIETAQEDVAALKPPEHLYSPAPPTKFSNYQLPGGENYREVLLTLPRKPPTFEQWMSGVERAQPTKFEQFTADPTRARKAYDLAIRDSVAPGDTAFQGDHFEEPNVLAHIRLNDRTDAQGKRVLFVEEIQSDWAQKARREGTVGADARGRFETWLRETKGFSPESAAKTAEHDFNRAGGSYWGEFRAREGGGAGVPAGPFVTSTEGWTNLALKRILRMAAEEGYDKVAWTRGEHQAARYDLSKQVDAIKVGWTNYAADGKAVDIYAKKRGESGFSLLTDGPIPLDKLPDVVGKDLAEKILAERGDSDKTYSGVDLKVGGEGMAGFYDKIVPDAMGKLGKKWGAKVGETEINTGQRRTLEDGIDIERWPGGEKLKVHSLDVTPEMRRSVVEEGQPQFATGEPGAPKPPDRAVVRAKLEALFKGQKVEDAGIGGRPDPNPSPETPFVVKTPSGSNIWIQPLGEIHFNLEQEASSLAKHGFTPDLVEAGKLRLAGSAQSIGKDSWIKIVDEGELPHEMVHVFLDKFASEREKAFVRKEWTKRAERDLSGKNFEETVADDFKRWWTDRQSAPSSVLGKVFQRIHDFFHKAANALGFETRGGLFREIESGKPFMREGVKPIPPGAKPGEPVPKLSAQPVPAPEAPPEPPEAPRTNATGFPKGSPEAAALEPESVGRPRVEAKVEELRKVEKLAGVNPEKLERDSKRRHKDLDPAVQKILRTTSDEALFGKAARGHLSDSEMMAMDARRRDLFDRADTAAKAAKDAQTLGNDPGPAQMLVLENALNIAAHDAVVSGRADVNAGTKAARALGARARVMQAGYATTDQFIRKVFREIPGVTDAQAESLYKILQTDPSKLPDALQQAMKPDKLDQFIYAWKNGLVSGPGTLLVANPLGNVGEQAMRLGETATASAVDSVLTRLGILKGERSRFSGEARAEMQGMFSRLPQAVATLGSDLKDVVKLAPEKLDLTRPLDHQVNPIGGKVGRAIGAPMRLLGAPDKFFQSIGGDAELGKLAYRKAKLELPKAPEAEILARKAKIIEEALNFEPQHRDLLASMETASKERVFQGEPKALMKSLLQMRANNRWLHGLLPFLQTPGKILDITLERSPLGFVKAARAFKAYEAARLKGTTPELLSKMRGEAVDAIARPLLGSAMLTAFAGLASSGFMTGSGPNDRKLKTLKLETGWQPYSFHIGDKYIPYNRFEPISSFLGVAADMVEAENEKSGSELAEKAFGSIVQNLTNKTYLASLADAAALFKDPIQFGSQYVQSQVSSLVPNVVAKAAQAIDPTVRDLKGVDKGLPGFGQKLLHSVEARIPGLSTTLPAKETSTGEPAIRVGTPGVLGSASRFLSPVQVSTEAPEADLERKLVDLGMAPSQPTRDFRVPRAAGKTLRLTEEEYDVLQEANKIASARARKLIASPSFQRLDEAEQARQLRLLYDRARDMQRERLLGQREFKVRLREAQEAP